MIYADHAATTQVSPAALDAMLPYLRQTFGNPSSSHSAGMAAARGLFDARAQIADCVGCLAREVIFTSGGSEADNQALLTMARIGRETGKTHLVASAFEHPAILQTLKMLERYGFFVTLVAPDATGIVQPEQIAAAMQKQTVGVSVMLANNEIGTLQPVEEIARLCREQGVLCHCDAVQAVGHVPVSFQKLGVDLLSLSGHKFTGPKGVGALIAKQGLELEPVIRGGGQERGVRAGTENMPGIAGMAAALRFECDRLPEYMQKVTRLRDQLAEGVLGIPGAHLTGDFTRHTPGIVHLCMEGLESETMLYLLNEAGICASAGSACSAGALTPSHVLHSMGIADELARGALRFSLGAENTEAEVKEIVQTLRQICTRLRKDNS